MRSSLQDAPDADGYRPNVGIVLFNGSRQVLWARRSRHDGWQFPQGGNEHGQTLEQAAFRELYEEVGLKPENVDLIGRTRIIDNRYGKSMSNFAGSRKRMTTKLSSAVGISRATKGFEVSTVGTR